MKAPDVRLDRTIAVVVVTAVVALLLVVGAHDVQGQTEPTAIPPGTSQDFSCSTEFTVTTEPQLVTLECAPVPPSPTPTPEPTPDPTPTPEDCTGLTVLPSQNLATVAANAPAGTTFCLTAGTFNVSSNVAVQSDDRFIGAGSTDTHVRTTSAQNIFDADETNDVEIGFMEISGATGTSSCQPQCGRGIWAGTNTTIRDVFAHHNANQGVGGGDSILIEASEFAFNGSGAFIGCCAGGVKSGGELRIFASSAHDNNGNGFWCDVDCPRFEVIDSESINNGRNGIRYEHGNAVSDAEADFSTALIRNNIVTGNNVSLNTPGGGIEVNSASDALIELNTLGGTHNAHGIVLRGSRHPVVRNVVRNNDMNGDTVSCPSGNTCTNNTSVTPAGFSTMDHSDETGHLINHEWSATPTAANPATTCNGLPGTMFAPVADTNPETIDNSIVGTNGDDVFIGTMGSDQFFGQGGNDTACFFDNSDDFYGNTGADWANMGSDNDSFEGHSGDDTAFMGNSVFFPNQANYPGPLDWDQWLWHGDIVCAGGSNCNSQGLPGETDNDVIHGEGGADNSCALGPGADIFYGGTGEDNCYGQTGNDELHGGDGPDDLVGGPDNDWGHGNEGDDTCTFIETKFSC